MRNLVILTFMLFGILSFGQDKKIIKPEYVIIANSEIITKAQLNNYGNDGYIKSMNKGVSEAYRNELAEEFGDKIGEKEFIIIIDLFTEEEKTENQNKTTESPKQPKGHENANLTLNVNAVAKDFTVQMINGESVTLSDLKGKVVLLNFWATWCAPCLMEFYEIPDKIIAPFKNDDFVFLTISAGENKDIVIKKMQELKEKGIDFNSGYDTDKKIVNLYKTKSFPKNFIIDKEGIIKYIATGYTDENIDVIASEIEKLLEE
ncbi:TlpA disulfide reductase family protein [Formosa sp. PL04]|uniref:TlpA family protein disulfide reductase n=1 Tax=Formosa sp. PL04 TaxID=3081755 RepID=UPI00298234E4|nr:TlpA disulfide reductase family protein [Formosa sp. PL04]MDW5287648.1 TlpA disulfide reductase family protein [Formosa sp. PL04]